MLKKVTVFIIAMLVVATAYGQAVDFVQWDQVEHLKTRYRNAKIRGELEEAIKIGYGIVELYGEQYESGENVIGDYCDWRMKLAEDLLKLGKTEKSRDEFLAALEVEPSFQEAEIGAARTYALAGNDEFAKDYMLSAARKGYRVALMMHKSELKKYFEQYNFVIKMIEIDKPEIEYTRDPFINPLRRATTPVPPKPSPRKNLTLGAQRAIVEEMRRYLGQAIEYINTGMADRAMTYYELIEECYAKKPQFTDEKLIEQLEIYHENARQSLYPRISSLFREQTVSRASELLGELEMAVNYRDREEAGRLNDELLSLIKKSGRIDDKQLKTEMEALEKKRAKSYRIIEVINRFEKEIRPLLHLRGTITGKDSGRGNRAFIDISAGDEKRQLIVGESDKVGGFDDLRVVRVEENSVSVRYEDVLMTLKF